MTTRATSIDFRHGVVEMAHGGGGRAMARLIEELFAAAFDNEWLRELNDQAFLSLPAAGQANLVMATDSHVISPLFFPGGNIGSLAVHGTVNDVAMSGARPLYLSAAFILEEGFPLADLKRIVDAMAEAARSAGVAIVTGDTKVVENGKGDGVFITTTGVGVVEGGRKRSPASIQPGDRVLVSGSLGDHGVAILSKREGLTFETEIESDSQSLQSLVAAMVAAVPDIRCMRDPTRGGLAAVLNEMAGQAGVGIALQESALPVRPQVRAACEFLGLDPLYVANEGKLVALCPPEYSEQLLSVMHAHPQGREAAVVGTVTSARPGSVSMTTAFGGERMVDWLTGEQLPRIC